MTVPMEYRLASRHFDDFLGDAAEEAGLTTRHQAYTMVQGVLQTFRRRLSVEQSIAFAQILPPLPRALFVQDWDPADARETSWDPATMAREVQALRVNHNISPDTAIRDVAAALRRYVEPKTFEACLSQLPPAAGDFWSVRAP